MPGVSEAAQQARRDARGTTDPLELVTDEQAVFLREFAGDGRIKQTAKAVGSTPTAHYRWLRTSPHYREAFLEARDRAVDTFHDELVTRAVFGVERKASRRYSDTLLMFLLKSLRPSVYREGPLDPATGERQPLLVKLDLSALTDKQLDEVHAKVQRLRLVPHPTTTGGA